MLLERKFRNLVRKIADGEEVTKNDFAICNIDDLREIFSFFNSKQIREDLSCFYLFKGDNVKLYQKLYKAENDSKDETEEMERFYMKNMLEKITAYNDGLKNNEGDFGINIENLKSLIYNLSNIRDSLELLYLTPISSWVNTYYTSLRDEVKGKEDGNDD